MTSSSLLHQAVAKGSPEELSRCLDVYYIDEKDPETEATPLAVASGLGRVAIIKCLLDHHVRPVVDARDRDGRTALIHAASSGHVSGGKVGRAGRGKPPLGALEGGEGWVTRADPDK